MADPKTDAQNAADDAVDKAVHEARTMKDEAESAIEQYRQKAESLQDDLLNEVRERPLRALAIGAMIGFAIGAVWKS